MMLMVRVLVLACVPSLLAAGAGISNAARETGLKHTGLVVYWSGSPWPSIWAMRPDGSHRYRILHNRQNGKRPRLSPDRKWVAFDGAPASKPAMSDFDIQLVRLDGTGLRTLTKSAPWDVDAQWSPDGSLLSFTRMPPGADWLNSSIWTIRPGGSGSRLVLASPQLDQPADWSADGERILFTRFNNASGTDTDVYVMNADGTEVRKRAKGIAACWSPDGSKILYTASSRLFVMATDGSHKRRISSVETFEPYWR
jgi:Tol biopolymer transport system component